MVSLRLYVTARGWLGELQERLQPEDGASAVEYGLLIALIAAVIIAVVRVLGQKVSNGFESFNAQF